MSRTAPLCIVLLALFMVVLSGSVQAQSVAPEGENAYATWFELTPDGDARIHLYFFWSKTCPHCQEAHPFITALPEQFPWLDLHDYELSESQENGQRYAEMAAMTGSEAMYVPAFFFCGNMTSGYGSHETTGATLVEGLEGCHEFVLKNFAVAPVTSAQPAVPAAVEPEPAVPAVGEPKPAAAAVAGVAAAPVLPAVDSLAAAPALALPLVGEIGAESMSLPALTMVVAGLDAFNPCAFFVLMFLLSLMVHARSRKRMLLIGVTFIFFSGLIYFIFMAAWLNVFLWVGELQLITLAAGIIAVAIALINIKDYFWFKQGVSLSIPERAKPGLYQRSRNLVRATSLPAMLAGTVVLAVAANSYELLCTSGFPMVYTRMLTLHDLPTSTFYAYLAAYNIVYVLPLLLIVLLFTVRFGAHKLTEGQGRVLKLLSGLMMLFLGLILIFAPAMLNNLTTAFALLLMTLLVTVLIVLIDRWWRAHRGPPPLAT